ncbi:hypothetical protein D3C81_493920 [compost metagenome]
MLAKASTRSQLLRGVCIAGKASSHKKKRVQHLRLALRLILILLSRKFSRHRLRLQEATVRTERADSLTTQNG